LISKCNCHIGSTMRQVLEDMLAAVFIKLNKTKQNTLAQENYSNITNQPLTLKTQKTDTGKQRG